MHPCESCKPELLNYLYDLLEEDARRELQAHLDACPDCRAALERAREQRTLLVAATRSEFPEVQFTPPVDKPRVLPLTSPQPAAQVTAIPRARRSWRRWAVAASIALVLTGSAAFAFYGWQGHRTQVADAEDKLRQARLAVTESEQTAGQETTRSREEIERIRDRLRKLMEEWKETDTQVRRKIGDKDVEVIVTGPKTVRPGMPTTYEVELKRPRDEAAKDTKDMSIRVGVVDAATKKELLSTEGKADKFKLDIPADLALKPGVEPVLEVVGKRLDGAEVRLGEQLPLATPFFLTHLATDRPMYRPGEVVHFRALTLERLSLTPADADLQVRFALVGPNGREIARIEEKTPTVRPADGDGLLPGPDGKPLRGIAAGEFRLPADLPGGEYAVVVSEGNRRFATERRKILVNRPERPRYNKELTFHRKSYGPGDDVQATAKFTDAAGGGVFLGNLVAKLRVDNRPEQVVHGILADANGDVRFNFKLPAAIERGDASLTVTIVGDGIPESLVRPVPLVLGRLNVDFYPEGGDLVAEVPNRVYFHASTPLGKPADIRARIVDDRGNEIAQTETLADDREPGVNQGNGLVEFIPRDGRRYSLKIDAPIGVTRAFALPPVNPDGVALAITRGVVDDKIEAVLHSGGRDRKLVVAAYCRDRLIDTSAVVDARRRSATRVSLKTSPALGGVYRVTVFELSAAQGNPVPVAERLVYRRPVHNLDLRIDTARSIYRPGDEVEVSVAATNEKKERVPAVLLLAAVDYSTLKLADEKTARSLPTYIYLGTEVRRAEDLEYADFLVSDHPKAAAALDLLLGTQGWRRFAPAPAPAREAEHLAKEEAEGAARALGVLGDALQRTNATTKLALDKVDKQFGPRLVALSNELADKRRAGDAQRKKEVIAGMRAMVHLDHAQRALGVARGELEQYLENVWRIGLAVGVGVLLAVAAGLILLGFARQARGGGRATPYLATGLALLGLLFVGSLIGLGHLMRDRDEWDMAWGAGGQGKVAFAPGDLAAVAPDPAREPAREPARDFADDGAPVLGLEAPKRKDDAFFEQRAGGDRPAEPLLLEEAQKRLEDAGQPMPDGERGVAGRDAARRDAAEVGAALRAEAELFDARPDIGFVPRVDQLGEMDGLDAFRLERRELAGRRTLRQFAAGELKREVLLPNVSEPFVVREYAHVRRGAADGMRRDFAETLYWHPVLVLPDGTAKAKFQLCDSATQFQIIAMGHTLDGRLGAKTAEISSRLPISVQPAVPVEVSSADKITVPITVTNNTEKTAALDLHVQTRELKESEAPVRMQEAKPGDSLATFHFEPAALQAQARLLVLGDFGALGADRVERALQIVPDGFPVNGAFSGLLKNQVSHEVRLPESWIPGSLTCQVQLYPSALADLQKSLEGLLREPNGCFEQASSSNYPNVLILNYLQETKQNRPEVEKEARRLLRGGYDKLTSFECIDPKETEKRRGYEWFGQTAPPHEALTAYGLLQFKDMASVQTVDKAMVERTRKYLLDQRDGKGGFRRNPRAVDQFGRAPEHITNAYIVWALTESGGDDLSAELRALAAQAAKSQDPYFLSLVALSQLNRKQSDDAARVLRAVVKTRKQDGHVEGTDTSITGSRERNLHIETTALAALAWLRADDSALTQGRAPLFEREANDAVTWLATQRGSAGGFGTTQATILTLKALLAQAQGHQHDRLRPAELRVRIEQGKEQVQHLPPKMIPAKASEPITVNLPADVLRPGVNRVELTFAGDAELRYTLTWSYRTEKPDNPANCPVQVQARLNQRSAKQGDTVKLSTRVENTTADGQGMAVAIIGLPAGLTLPEDFAQLKDAARTPADGGRPTVSFWELRGRELILYWRDLAPRQKIDLNVDLVCRFPGEYRGPASRAYLYYNPERTFWTEPLAIQIAP